MDKSEIIPSVGDRNLGPMLIGANWAIFGPATILVCLRLITRLYITHNFGWDDAVIAITQVRIPHLQCSSIMWEREGILGRQ